MSLLQEYCGYNDCIDTEKFPFQVLLNHHLSYSDHSDSGNVQVSNYQTFLKNFGDCKGVYTISGLFNYHAIALSEEALKNPEIIKTLNALEDYPCIDDVGYSKLEWEMYLEHWEDSGYNDFIQHILANAGTWQYAEDFLVESDLDALRRFYESLIPSNCYYTSEHPNSIDLNIGEALKHCNRDKIAQFIRSERSKQRKMSSVVS